MGHPELAVPAALIPALAGMAAAVLSVLGTAVYVRDVRSGRTRPHRGTWAIWCVIGVIGTASHAAEGVRWSLLMVSAQTATTALVLLIAVRRGVGTVNRTNAAMLVLAGLGVVGWQTSSDPTVATACVVLADAVGVALMLPKTWVDPHGETLSTFSCATAAGLLGMVAVGEPNPDLLLLPGYLFAANAVTVTLIAGRRTRRLRWPDVAPVRAGGVRRWR